MSTESIVDKVLKEPKKLEITKNNNKIFQNKLFYAILLYKEIKKLDE